VDVIERGTALRQALAQAGGVGAIDRFIAASRNLTRADREMLGGWADDPVRGVFEVRSADDHGIIVLNLVDDLYYRVYGLARQPVSDSFVTGTLLPLTDDDEAWLASGDQTFHPREDARTVARFAIEMATREPELVFRNPEKVSQGWEHMRRDREEFLAFFGRDELVLPTVEAEGRLNAYYRRRRDAALAARGRHRAVSETGETTFVMPEGFYEFDTVGIIYDDVDGFVVLPEYGMLRSLFASPALAADREHASVLRAYLREDSIPPLPLRRLAAAFPDNVDAVFRRVLGNKNFSWSQNGPGLLRKRKPGHNDREPLPGVAVLSDRVLELASGKRLRGGHEVRVKLGEGVEDREIGERGQRPLGRLPMQAGPGDRRVEQAVHVGRLGAVGRLDLHVAQRQAGGQLHVLDRAGRVAQSQADYLGQEAEHGDHRVPRFQLRVSKRGRDLLPCLAAAGRAQGGGQCHVQPPGGALGQRLVVARRGDPDDLADQRPAALHRPQ